MDYPIKSVTVSDPDYPRILTCWPGMPRKLYYIGSLPDPDCKSAAIVGARACSAYGREQARQFAAGLGRAGVQIISGMALGIDSHAHEGCLSAGGRTFAVLGNGVDICYPASNERLYRRIIESGGGILSEFEPGMPSLPHHFPLRNRIISGLADLVLIVEARAKSGSLITAQYALEQGKNIFAVPGRIGDPLSAGCNNLISKGAGAATDAAQLLAELGFMQNEKGEISSPLAFNSLSPSARTLLKVLSTDPQSLSALLESTGLSAADAFRGLLELEVKSLVRQPVAGLYVRTYG